ncbi:MAG: 30S ribosomal protein S17 [bacterium]
MSEEKVDNKKVRQGIVVSDAMDKTLAVELHSTKQHPLYEKYLDRTNNIKVHDEEEEAGVGDEVLVKECRPLSKEKTWRLIDIIEKGGLAAREEVAGGPEEEEISGDEE